MYNKNNKGFTLVELLVVLAISALILIMAIPSINNISGDTQDEEYQEYMESIVYGAKLYYRQKYDDISGWNNVSSTNIDANTRKDVVEAKINYSDLVSANYIKDFSPTERGSKKKCNTSINPDAVSITITETRTVSKKDSSIKNKKISYKVNGLECGSNKLKPVKEKK